MLRLASALVLAACTLGAQPHLVIQESHRAWISSASFRPDGRLLATGGAEGTVKVWDTSSGRLLRTFANHGRPIGMGFTPEGRKLVVGGVNSSAAVIDVHTGKVLMSRRLFDQGGYCGAAISADGKLFAGGGDRNFAIYRTADHRLSHHFKGPQEDRFLAAAFSPKGTHVAVSSDEETIYILRSADGKEARRLKTSKSDVISVLFHPDDKHLISCDRQGDVVFWDWQTGGIVQRLTVKGGKTRKAEAIALSKDGKRIAVACSDGMVELYPFGSDAMDASFHAHEGAVSAIAFHPDGKTLVTGGNGGQVFLWDLATKKRLRSFGGKLDDALAVAATSSDTVPVTAWEPTHKRIRVWDLVSGRNVWTLPAEVTLSRTPWVSFSPEGSHLAFATRGATVQVFDLGTGKRSPTYAAGDKIKRRGAFALGPGGKTLACRVDENEIALWHHDKAQRVRTLPGKKYNDILSMSFSRDGAMLAQGGKGNFLQILATADGEKKHVQPSGVGWVFSLQLNRDQSKLLCGGPYSSIHLRTLPDFKSVHRMLGQRGSIPSVSFSKDERRLLSVGGDGTLRIWDAGDGKHLATLELLGVGEWILVTPDTDGRWDASPKAGDWCGWSVADPEQGLRFRSLTSLRQEQRVAGLAARVLGLTKDR